MTKKGLYEVYSYGDRLKKGEELIIKHSVRCNTVEMPNLICKTEEELNTMYDSNTAKEKAVFDKLCAAVSEWEEIAAQTQFINRAIEYKRTRPVEHTSNVWVDKGNNSVISNMVYKMYYDVYERTEYRRDIQKSVSVAWILSWYVYTNGVHDNGYGNKSTHIAGQERKNFKDKAAMEKYLNGRIAAYAHLFKEISPAIPKEYVEDFKVNGNLVQGYTVAE